MFGNIHIWGLKQCERRVASESTDDRAPGPALQGRTRLAQGRGSHGAMLTYIARRMLYSIPVSSLRRSCCSGSSAARSTRAPSSAARAKARRRTRGAKSASASTTRSSSSTRTGSRTPCRATSGESSRTNEDVSTMISRSLWYTVQLIFWGILVASIVAISLGVYSAVKQYSVLDYTFTGLSFVGLAHAAVLVRAARDPVPRDLARTTRSAGNWFNFVGLHSGDQTGFNLDYLQHLRAAGAHADGADHRGVEPVPAGLDARRDVAPTTSAPRAPRACRGAR